MSDYYSTSVDELPLFRRSDPETSKAAGRAAKEFLGHHERLIVEALAAGPGTKDELASRCRLTEQQVARRMHGLKRAGAFWPLPTRDCEIGLARKHRQTLSDRRCPRDRHGAASTRRGGVERRPG